MDPFFIFGLAVWRISSMLVNETGPWQIFERLRNRVGILHDQDGKPYQYPDGFFPQLLSCTWCCSVWVGAGVTAWSVFSYRSIYYISLALALSAFAIFLDAIIKKFNNQ